MGVRDFARISGSVLNITSSTIEIIGSGSLTTLGLGSTTGSGAGNKNSGTSPGGGGHGGNGGSTVAACIGTAHDSVYLPVNPGGKGGPGNSITNAGGGVIWLTADNITLDGSIICDGGSISGSGSGGGAGT